MFAGERLELRVLKQVRNSWNQFSNLALCVCVFHLQANTWYRLVLGENLLQEMLSGVDSQSPSTQWQRRSRVSAPVWRHKLSAFLKKHCPPDVEELLHLAHLSNVIPDDVVQEAGKQMSER